jgi:stage V sporulation protein G
MEITDIRIKKVESDNKLKAYVTVTFDDCFVVHNLKIIMGQYGRFVAMPRKGMVKWASIAFLYHPQTSPKATSA